MPFITKLADKALDGLVHSGKANAQCNIYYYWAGCIINQGICTGGWIQYEYFHNGACLTSPTGNWRCC